LRQLGEGSTVAVFLAYHEQENRQVAIKVLSKELAEKQPALDRFYREAKSGALLFKAMNCDGCHGGDATGWVGPNLGDARWRYGGADAEVFSSIYYGRPKGMPAFGGALGADGVWTLVTYLRSLPLPPDLPTESWEGQ